MLKAKHADQSAAQQEPQSGFLTIPETAQMLRISRRNLQYRIAANEIPHVKLGRRTLLHWPTVEAAVLRQSRGGVS
jgi:excisionase family DNA binding protein